MTVTITPPYVIQRQADVFVSITLPEKIANSVQGDTTAMLWEVKQLNAHPNPFTYFLPFLGTPDDCLPCGCPNGGACIQIDEDTIMCTECPVGYTGHRCDSCSDGYFGDPTGNFGPISSCEDCECNFNIDLNAIGNCNSTTGECLKCIYNTGGPNCEVCLPGK